MKTPDQCLLRKNKDKIKLFIRAFICNEATVYLIKEIEENLLDYVRHVLITLDAEFYQPLE